MAKSFKYIYSDIKFTIFERHKKWWLDFYWKKKRIRRSTELSANQDNLKVIKKQIIPDIIIGLGHKIEETMKTDKTEQTLNEFAQEFFDMQRARKEVREHVIDKNIAHYNKHIAPLFGDKKLVDIDIEELDKWQIQLLQNYKHLTVQKFRSVLFSILTEAVRYKRIQENPLSFVKAPKLKHKIDEDINPFTETELIKISHTAYGYMKNFIFLMVSTGMRPGEIVALKWNDINFEKKFIRINKTVVRGNEGDVKTYSSNRFVDMLPQAELYLQRQFELTGHHEFVFLSSFHKQFYSHDIIGVNFKKILQKSGVEVRKLYNLRHTFASQMISKGADIVWVSKILGHKDVSITLKIYTKFIQEDDDMRFKKIEKMGTILGTIEEVSV
ncbi:tyrosine-type recombinase/integrase [Sulfurimonas paralvinellae]|uniref:Site-specific integrase n=1 Tax=Sulfurimonas paralvinellae TaxID=317658 RepID=A0A7M1B772_9BACT|nr:site-specific integrase [Sulfurimonas paralvinellae]QOP45554.1 site-specific integrase [Sulfurimonas paralvinellae]